MAKCLCFCNPYSRKFHSSSCPVCHRQHVLSAWFLFFYSISISCRIKADFPSWEGSVVNILECESRQTGACMLTLLTGSLAELLTAQKLTSLSIKCNSLPYSVLLSAMSVTESPVVQKYSVENFRKKRFRNFQQCQFSLSVLSLKRRSHAVSFFLPDLSVIHSSSIPVLYTQPPVSHVVALSVIRSSTEVSQCLCSRKLYLTDWCPKEQEWGRWQINFVKRSCKVLLFTEKVRILSKERMKSCTEVAEMYGKLLISYCT